MNINKNACAFTGHRPKSFPWRYDETAHDCLLLKEILTEQIRLLTNRNVTVFLSGMALGVDLWCAEIVLDLRNENPAMQLRCVLPCKDQENKWSASEQERYYSILRQANDIVFVSRECHPGCMLERNRYMVDHSSSLLAVYNGLRRSGTGATVRYAQRLGREITMIDPVSRNIVYTPAHSSFLENR